MSQVQLPTTMKAWQYSGVKGGLEKNLKINQSAPLPKPKSDQHLVHIIATALNPVDYKPAEIPGVKTLVLPSNATPGIDFAGTIVKPAASSSLEAGQYVFGCAGASALAGGALREYSVASTTSTAPIPDGLEPLDASTIGVAGLTAYQSIVPHVKDGDKIFINGGSGGTGVFGIQFAKAKGCHVTTSCSTTNVDFCRSLGADRVIDYKKENVLEALKSSEQRFDHAVDNVGKADGEFAWHAHEFLRVGAILVMVGGEPSLAGLADNLKRKLLPSFMGGVKGKVVGFWPQQKPEDLTQIAEWMKQGKVKAVIDQRFPFEQVVQAFERLKTGRARGKIVIDVAAQAEKGASS